MLLSNLALTVLYLLTLQPVSANAQEIVIRDCSGNARAVKQVEASLEHRVTARLDGHNIDLVRLTREDKTEVFETQPLAEQIIFEQVTDGDWTLCDPSGTLSIRTVAITSDDVSHNSLWASLTGIAGTVGIVGSVSGTKSNNDSMRALPIDEAIPPSTNEAPNISPPSTLRDSIAKRATTLSSQNPCVGPSYTSEGSCFITSQTAPISPSS